MDPGRANRPVRIATQLKPQHSWYPTPRAAAAGAEDAGVHIVFDRDQCSPLNGEQDGKRIERLTMLGPWAEATHCVEIGALGNGPDYDLTLAAEWVAWRDDGLDGGRVGGEVSCVGAPSLRRG
jgi:hypothetical protein